MQVVVAGVAVVELVGGGGGAWEGAVRGQAGKRPRETMQPDHWANHQRLARPDADQSPRRSPTGPVHQHQQLPKVERPKSASILVIQRLAGSAKFSDSGHLL